VAVATTQEGPRLVGGQPGLTPDLRQMAAARGLTVVPNVPGLHPEREIIAFARQTSIEHPSGLTLDTLFSVHKFCDVCRAAIVNAGGRILEDGRTAVF
jgi:hypothetical protein